MLRRLAPLLLLTTLAGCAAGPQPREQHAAAPAPPSRDAVQAAQISRYLADLQTVIQGNPTEQAELIAASKAAYEQSKQGSAVLRYGLLLAAPVHAARDPVQAQRLLLEALSHPELLSSSEHGLAVLQLAQVDAELRLSAEVERLVVELQRDRERQITAPPSSASNRLLLAEREETARLRKALDEARAKLEALTRIERSFSDRPTAPEGRNQ